jgi:hypothetical protein
MLLISFVIWRTAVLTSSGQLMWFVSDSHSITSTNGKTEEALLHHCCQSQIWILTRREAAERVSYAIVPPAAQNRGYVWRCEGWSASRLPLFPYLVYWTDVAFDCDSDAVRFTHHQGRFDREVQFGDHSFAFAADDGSHLAVRWQ